MILSKYDGKIVRITDIYGEVITGRAVVYPAGYGLYEFDREEESIRIRDMYTFRSEIKRIEVLSGKQSETDVQRCNELMEELLQGPYWVVDILPEQVPKDSKGQYFEVDRYYIQPGRLSGLYHKYGEILLRLNCYYDMLVTFDTGDSWEKNPDPEQFSDRLIYFKSNELLRVLFVEEKTMIEIDFGYTDMAVWTTDQKLLDMVRKLAAAEGFFTWSLPVD